MECLRLTDDLTMDILFGEPALYPRQRAVYDAAFRGERNGYDLIHWGKSMNVSSLRQRLYYHGKEIVLGGDAYAHMWETQTATPCDILKVPHHASLSSTTRKLLRLLQPKAAVVCVAAGTSGRAAPSLYRLPAEGIYGRCPFHRCGGDPRPGGAGVPHVRPYRAAMRSSLIKKRPPQPPF